MQERFTRYNCLTGNFWKAPNNSINRKIYHHRDMVETDKYIKNVENFER